MPRNRDPLRYAFHRATPWFVAGRWLALGETLDPLAEALACPQAVAVRVGLCRAPQEGEALDAWTRTIAEYAGVDVERVRQVAYRIAMT
ncbi:MAG: hypothetical protein HY689_09445 [Chloroflexi bacterium]|nr:hypothetical protein [Chloroflexota bacterium]